MASGDNVCFLFNTILFESSHLIRSAHERLILSVLCSFSIFESGIHVTMLFVVLKTLGKVCNETVIAISKYQRTRQKGDDFCWKVLDPVQLLFCVHWLFTNYINAMLLLVSRMSTHDHLFYFYQGLDRINPQNSKQKHTTKNFAKVSSTTSPY